MQQNLVGLGGNGTSIFSLVPCITYLIRLSDSLVGLLLGLPNHQLGRTAQVLFMGNLWMRAARDHPSFSPSFAY